MKRTLLIVVVLLTPNFVFPQSPTTKLQSKKTNQTHLEVRVKPFVDLYFFVYKLSAGSEKAPDIDGFAQAVEAARQTPLTATLFDLALFRSETAADAVKAFSQFPETYKTRKGEVVPRERVVHLAKTLVAIENAFLERVWPQHKIAIEPVAARIAKILGPKEEECFAYMTKHLGMEDAKYTVPVYLVAETPWPGAFTMWSESKTSGVCLIEVGPNKKDPQLFEAILHESIHALDLETKGQGNVLVELRSRLLKAGFKEDDQFVRHAPHFLVFIQSVETVRRYLDSTYQPYETGVFARPALQPIKNVELPLWTAYLDGKLSREDALNQMVEGFLKARNKDTAPKI